MQRLSRLLSSALVATSLGVALVPAGGATASATTTGQFATLGCPIGGLVSRWSGENDARDGVGGQHGQAIRNVGFTPGVVGQAFDLDGDSFILVPDSARLDLLGAYTLSAWVNYKELWSWTGILAKRESAAPPGSSYANYGINFNPYFGYGLGAYYDDPKVAYVGDDGNEFEVVRVESAPPSEWFHVAVTVQQGGGTAGPTVEMNVYLDGQAMRSHRLPGSLQRSVNDVPLVLGASATDEALTAHEALHGALDEVSIYHRALSPTEVRGLFSAQSVGSRC